MLAASSGLSRRREGTSTAVIVNTQPNREAEAFGAGLQNFFGGLAQGERYKAELRRARERQLLEQQRYDESINYRSGRDRAEDARNERTDRRLEGDAAAKTAQSGADRNLQLSMMNGVQAGESPQGPTPEGTPIGGTFEEQQQLRAQAFQKLISDPALSSGARKYAIDDFKENEAELVFGEQNRLADEGLLRTRQSYIDSGRQGSVPEETVGEILPTLDPSGYVTADGKPDLKGKLQAITMAEQAKVAARKNMVRQQTDDQLLSEFDQTFATALDAARPAFEAGVFSPEEMAQGRFDYNMLRADWGDLKPSERANRAQEILGKLDFKARAQEMLAERDKARAADPRNAAMGDKTKKLFMEGVDSGGVDAYGNPARRQVSFDEASRMAQTQGLTSPTAPTVQPTGGLGQPPGVNGSAAQAIPETQPPVPAAGQAGPPAQAVQPQVGAARPPGVQPMPGKRRTRDEILGEAGGKGAGPAQDPAPMHEAVAKAIMLGIPLDQFQDIYGIDLSTLTDEDLRQIEAMAGKPPSAGVQKARPKPGAQQMAPKP